MTANTVTSGANTASSAANTASPRANTASSRGLPDEVGYARELVMPALRTAVEELDPVTRDVVGYHFGWTDQHGNELADGGGKTLRPALAVLCAQAAGADPATAVPGAVAVELVHNFSLLHDDVMDGDTERRQQPTVWWRYGIPTAILAGDALLTLAMDTVERSGSHAASSAVTSAVQELIAGQRKDVGFETRHDVELPECMEMVDGKTGALMCCAARVGPLLGGATTGTAQALGRFGRDLGTAFQLVDDLLGIRGDPAVTGKPVGSDLRAGKKTVPVVAALNSGTPAAGTLAEMYFDRTAASESELRHMVELLDRCGALRWTEQAADAHVARALRSLRHVDPPPGIRDALHQFAAFITERDT